MNLFLQILSTAVPYQIVNQTYTLEQIRQVI